MKYKEIMYLEQVFAPRETNDYEGMFICVNPESDKYIINFHQSEEFEEFQTLREAYEYIESRFYALTEDKEILDSTGIVLQVYLNELRNKIARESRRGYGNVIYKNFIFYDGDHIKADAMIGVWNVDGAYRVYENPNAKKYIQRMINDLQNY